MAFIIDLGEDGGEKGGEAFVEFVGDTVGAWAFLEREVVEDIFEFSFAYGCVTHVCCGA